MLLFSWVLLVYLGQITCNRRSYVKMQSVDLRPARARALRHGPHQHQVQHQQSRRCSFFLRSTCCTFNGCWCGNGFLLEFQRNGRSVCGCQTTTSTNGSPGSHGSSPSNGHGTTPRNPCASGNPWKPCHPHHQVRGMDSTCTLVHLLYLFGLLSFQNPSCTISFTKGINLHEHLLFGFYFDCLHEIFLTDAFSIYLSTCEWISYLFFKCEYLDYVL